MQSSLDNVMYWLNKLGNTRPSKSHIKLMESLLNNVSITKEIIYCEHLTIRETACLRLITQGHTAKEIAGMLNCSSKTIYMHRRAIFKKLKCKNMAQAVFEGIRYGYFTKF